MLGQPLFTTALSLLLTWSCGFRALLVHVCVGAEREKIDDKEAKYRSMDIVPIGVL